MSMQFEQVAGPFSFTEGTAGDGDGGVLFCDIPNSRVDGRLRRDPRQEWLHVAQSHPGEGTASGCLFRARTERTGHSVHPEA